MADLISSTRAKYAFGGTTINSSNLTLSSAESTTLDAIISGCSTAIKKFCRRQFDSQTFDQLYDAAENDGDEGILLREFPIISVARVACNPATVLQIINNSTANQRATVAVTATGLSLVRVASGSSTTDTSVTWASNATIQAVADAVNALGNGWAANIPDDDYALRASADFLAVQGALNCKDVYAGLQIHVSELSSYSVDQKLGIIYPGPPNFISPFFESGRNHWRIIYTAGYATVPEDIQEACAQWVAQRFWATKRDPGLINQYSGGTGVAFDAGSSVIPQNVVNMIAPYRKRRA